jgi:2-octaprenyl-6-methoxyphenol hydroxylase
MDEVGTTNQAYTLSTQATDLDVLVVGGGLVGASVACALAGASLRVGIAEAVPLDKEPPSYDDRSLALSLGSKRILEALGLWAYLVHAASPIQEVHVSQRGHFGATRFRAEDEGVAALGYVVKARALGEALRAGFAQHRKLTLMSPAQVVGVYAEQDGIRAGLRKGTAVIQTVRAGLLVAADGARSTVRHLLGLAAVEHDYGESAIAAQVTPSLDHRGIAYERFSDPGTVALLPLKERQCGLIWTLPSEIAEILLDLDEKAFLEALNQAFGSRLGRLIRVGHRVRYPLRLVSSKVQIAPRAVIIGNAAHTLHPIAAQGFNLGLRDAAALAEIVLAARRSGEDWGSAPVLRRYLDSRRHDQRSVTLFTDTLARLFSIRSQWVSGLRSLGLLGTDLLPCVKHGLARRAMGLAGRQLRLSRGLPP